jgi:hypothetical protein
MTNPVNTQKIASFQPAKVDAEPMKQKSKTVDVLEPAKKGTQASSGTNSKSWFSSCLEKIWNFFKCIFCCGYLKKDSESSTTSKSETKEPSSTTSATTKDGATKIKPPLDKSQADKLKGYDREIFAARWMMEAMENKNEAEYIKALEYGEMPDADRATSLQIFKSNLTDAQIQAFIQEIQKSLDAMLQVKKFATLVLTKDSTNDETFKAWEALEFMDRDNFRQILGKVDYTPKEDFDAGEAIRDYCYFEKEPEKLAKYIENIKAHIKSPLMQRTCQRLLDIGVEKALI